MCNRYVSPEQGEVERFSIEAGNFDQWLENTADHAQGLMKLAPVAVFDGGPTDAAQKEIA